MLTLPPNSPTSLKLGLPKGRMQHGVLTLLAEAGIKITASDRGYRPQVSLAGVEAKLLKPQNIIEMLSIGTRDLGFAGSDWVAELGVDVVEVLDTHLDAVRVVAAAPSGLFEANRLPPRPLVVVSEYQRLAKSWIEQRAMGDRFVRSYGATEVFPPEDADVIIDVTATGATLVANGLTIVQDVMKSSTRLFASRQAMADAAKRTQIDDIALLLSSVLEARKRVMLEVNVSEACLAAVVAVLPCMKRPTVSRLASIHAGGRQNEGEAGYAVKAAILRDQLAVVIPLLKAKGGTDVVISPISQVVP